MKKKFLNFQIMSTDIKMRKEQKRLLRCGPLCRMQRILWLAKSSSATGDKFINVNYCCLVDRKPSLLRQEEKT